MKPVCLSTRLPVTAATDAPDRGLPVCRPAAGTLVGGARRCCGPLGWREFGRARLAVGFGGGERDRRGRVGVISLLAQRVVSCVRLALAGKGSLPGWGGTSTVRSSYSCGWRWRERVRCRVCVRGRGRGPVVGTLVGGERRRCGQWRSGGRFGFSGLGSGVWCGLLARFVRWGLVLGGCGGVAGCGGGGYRVRGRGLGIRGRVRG